jgi:excisionase family DNA binding protein
MEPREMTEPWSSVDEVARQLEVAKASICRWIEARDTPAHELGRISKLKLSEVDWARSGGTEGGGKAATKKAPRAKRGRS